jgi:hypothetical protein
MRGANVNKKKNLTRLFFRLNIFLTFLCMLSMLWAALSGIGIVADGSWVFVSLLTRKIPVWDHSYLRLFPISLQLPSLAWLNLVPGEKSVPVAALFYNLTLNLHGCLSLFASGWLLRRFRREDLFIFPAFNFVLCTQILMGFPYLIVQETLSLYWPLLLLLLLRKGDSRWELPALLLGFFCLAFSYEAAILLFALNLGLLFFSRIQGRSVAGDNLLLISNFIGLAFMAWRLLGAHHGPTDTFWAGLRASTFREPYREFSEVLIFLICLAILIWRGDSRRDRTLGSALAIAALLAGLRFFWMLAKTPAITLFSYTWQERTTVIPFSATLAGVCFWVVNGRKHHNFKASRTFQALQIALGVSLCLSLAHTLIVTSFWRHGSQRMAHLQKENPGCNVFDLHSAGSLIDWALLGNWLSTYSLNPGVKPELKSVFFVEDPPTGAHCRLEESAKLPRDHFFMLDEYQNFKFSREALAQNILALPIRIHRWNAATNEAEVEINPRNNSHADLARAP